MNVYDQELRERCLRIAADVFKSSGITGQQLTAIAEHFFQYIKYGGDTEHDVDDEPTPPVNTGPGMSTIRRALRDHSVPDYARQ